MSMTSSESFTKKRKKSIQVSGPTKLSEQINAIARQVTKKVTPRVQLGNI